MAEKIPAWLLCEDMLNRAKNEFITEAIEELNRAIEEKTIEVNGELISMPDRPSDTERDMFVINRLLAEYPKMKEQYGEYIEKNADTKDPKKIEAIERLKRFLLSLDTIATLMRYSHEIDEWQHDVAMQVPATEPSKVMAKTIKGNRERSEILELALKSKTFEKEEIFTKEERQIISQSLTSNS